MADNESIIREFIAAWSNLDADELTSYFTEDGIYNNMPAQPVSGHDNLRAFIGAFIGSWESTQWDILNLMADGDMVMVERLDRTIVAGIHVDLPCLGIFHMRDGKIAEWRDYFDMATYTNALA